MSVDDMYPSIFMNESTTWESRKTGCIHLIMFLNEKQKPNWSCRSSLLSPCDGDGIMIAGGCHITRDSLWKISVLPLTLWVQLINYAKNAQHRRKCALKGQPSLKMKYTREAKYNAWLLWWSLREETKTEKYLSLTSDMWSASAMTAAHMHTYTIHTYMFYFPSAATNVLASTWVYVFINAFILLSLSLRASAHSHTRSSHTRTHWPHINSDLTTTRPMTNYFLSNALAFIAPNNTHAVLSFQKIAPATNISEKCNEWWDCDSTIQTKAAHPTYFHSLALYRWNGNIIWKRNVWTSIVRINAMNSQSLRFLQPTPMHCKTNDRRTTQLSTGAKIVIIQNLHKYSNTVNTSAGLWWCRQMHSNEIIQSRVDEALSHFSHFRHIQSITLVRTKSNVDRRKFHVCTIFASFFIVCAELLIRVFARLWHLSCVSACLCLLHEMQGDRRMSRTIDKKSERR